MSVSEVAGGSKPSSSTTASSSVADRMKKLKELHMRRNEARRENHAEVVEEDKRKNLPANYEARKRRQEWIVNEEKRKQEALDRGEDYDRVKHLDITADEAERLQRKKKKKNPDTGFSDYEAATFRLYERNVKGIKVDMDKYESEREKLGEAFYPTAGTVLHGLHKDSQDSINKMADDVERQISKRDKYSRRRKYDPDADVDYINERNMAFNKKLERFYGDYTQETKQNLERGTAV